MPRSPCRGTGDRFFPAWAARASTSTSPMPVPGSASVSPCVGAIGVDIVAESELTDWERLAEHFLAPDERREIHMAPPQSRRGLAARAWVAKEAVLKAAGYGLAVDPQAVELELRPAVRGAPGAESATRACVSPSA